MSLKRKLEEYHDPDYPKIVNDNKKARSDNQQYTPEERCDKIKEIIKREFQRELQHKEEELQQIENKLLQSKRLLQRVRYAVVFNYYSKKNLQYSENELIADRTDTNSGGNSNATITDNLLVGDYNSEQGVQKAIHPSLQKLLGKKPIDYNELLKIRAPRKAANTAKTSISEKLRSKKDEKRLRQSTIITETVINHQEEEQQSTTTSVVKVPRYIEPTKIEETIPQVNSARRKDHTKHLIAVGNTSQYIGDDKTCIGVTHKWLIYVKTKTDVPIEQMINKVRFFLHPSYKPNDVIEVKSAPFHISRRGWGEFPIRVQLYFHPEINQKPLQILHNLVLDKKLTGFQTMGAETIVEVWLNLCAPPPPPLPLESIHELIAEDHRNLFDDFNDDKNNDTALSSLLLNTNPDSNIDNIYDDINLFEMPMPTDLFDESSEMFTTSAGNSISDITSPYSVKQEDVPTSVDIPNASFSTSIKQENVVVSVEEPHNIIETNVGNSQVENYLASSEPLPPPPPTKINNVLLQAPVNNSPPKNNNLSAVTANKLNASSTMNHHAVVPAVPIENKKFIKCMDKNGKIVLLQIKTNQTQGNQNNFKIMQNQNVQLPATKVQTISSSNKMILVPTPPRTVIATSKPILKMPFVQSKAAVSTTSNTKDLFLSQVAPVATSTKVQSTSTVERHLSIVEPSRQQSTVVNVKPKSMLNSQSVVMKNGQVFLLDSKKINKINQPKQQSLLKPQISLLKPITGVPPKQQQPNNVSKIPPVSNLTTTNLPQTTTQVTKTLGNVIITNKQGEAKPVKILTTASLSGADKKLTMIPSLMKFKQHPNSLILNTAREQQKKHNLPFILKKSMFNSNSKFIITNLKKEYGKDLENLFFVPNQFVGIRSAVEFLLKRVPLINPMAENGDYISCFPFVTNTEERFRTYLLPKQRCLEWYRAKYIHRLLIKHEDLYNLKHWSPKEIILFSRQFAYAPSFNNDLSQTTNFENRFTENSLASLIKYEINKERLQENTLTHCSTITDWIKESNLNRNPVNVKALNEMEIINIDELEDISLPSKDKTSMETKCKNLFDVIPIEENLIKESTWIADVCRDIQIKLQPEEILKGVEHPTAQRLLIQAVHSFLEELIRKSFGAKTESEHSAVKDTVVRPDDIRKVISTLPHFDFLSNKYLGVD